MRDPKGKTVTDMFPQIFEDDDDCDDEPPITEDEAAELQALMDSINAQNIAASPTNSKSDRQ